jgi:hypothetical protein
MGRARAAGGRRLRRSLSKFERVTDSGIMAQARFWWQVPYHDKDPTRRLDGERGQLIAAIAQSRGRIVEIETQILQIDRIHPIWAAFRSLV